MADVNYQSPMQLMELLGLRGWENAQPRVYWGLRRPDGLPLDWYAPNAGLGGAGAGSWGGSYQGGYGTTTGGGGGFNSASIFSAPLSGAPSAAQSARFFSGGPESGPGQSDLGAMSQTPGSGLNAQSASLGDWLGSFTSPVTAFGSLVGQIGYNALTGQPNKPINTVSLTNMLGFGGGSAPQTSGEALAAEAKAAADASAYGGGIADVGGAGAGSNSEAETGGEAAASEAKGAAEAGGHFYSGGPVTLDRLIGPNPPGPDDGMAYLDAGEHVLTAEEVRKMGGHGAVMKLRDLIRRA